MVIKEKQNKTKIISPCYRKTQKAHIALKVWIHSFLRRSGGTHSPQRTLTGYWVHLTFQHPSKVLWMGRTFHSQSLTSHRLTRRHWISNFSLHHFCCGVLASLQYSDHVVSLIFFFQLALENHTYWWLMIWCFYTCIYRMYTRGLKKFMEKIMKKILKETYLLIPISMNY